MTMSRRSFIALTAVSVATPSNLFQPSGNSREAYVRWYSVMRRCGQINFNERDPLTLDTEAWAGYWASLKVDAVLLNCCGNVACYPTQEPYQHRSESLVTR